MKVLLVSEDQRLLDDLSSLLTSVGHRCTLASPYNAQPESEDLILLDADTVQHAVFNTCLKWRQSFGERIPVVILTERHDEWFINNALTSGAVDFIQKPLNSGLLTNKLVTLSKLRKANEALAFCEHQLETLSDHDELTHLFNSKGFLHALEREWRRMTRDRAQMSLIVLKVDRFKDYRTLVGELSAQHCLEDIAATLEEMALRPADTLARLEQECFAVLLPGTDMEGAITVAVRMQNAVSDMRINANHAIEPLQLCVGIAHDRPNQHVNSTRILERAKLALHEASSAGSGSLRVNNGGGVAAP